MCYNTDNEARASKKGGKRKMKKYTLIHRGTKEERIIVANSAQEACEYIGWFIADTFVKGYEEVITEWDRWEQAETVA